MTSQMLYQNLLNKIKRTFIHKRLFPKIKAILTNSFAQRISQKDFKGKILQHSPGYSSNCFFFTQISLIHTVIATKNQNKYLFYVTLHTFQ